VIAQELFSLLKTSGLNIHSINPPIWSYRVFLDRSWLSPKFQKRQRKNSIIPKLTLPRIYCHSINHRWPIPYWLPGWIDALINSAELKQSKETLINLANEMKHEAHETQQPRHINMIGEGASTAQRSDSLVQSINQRFPKWQTVGNK